MPTTDINLEIENPITALDAVDQIIMHLLEGQPVMLWGASGIGKSELAHQIAQKMASKLIPFHTNIRESVDVRGLPVPDLASGTTVWLAPKELPKSDGSDGPTLLFIDEINTGTMQMMSVMMQLVLDRRVGDYTLPDNCVILAAGNRSKDSRAVIQMPVPLRRRFAHYTMVVDVPSWIAHAKATNLAPELVAFIRFRPDCLYRDADGDQNASANPRTIYRCGPYIKQPPARRLRAFTAMVGKVVASEMESFVSLYQSLTSLDDILANPTTAKLPSEPSERYAVCTAIARLADRKTFPNVIAYAKRLPREFEVLTVTDAVSRDDKLANVAAYGKWAVENSDVTVQ
jgi:hypothetical protein